MSECADAGHGADWYLFGSAAKAHLPVSDIDILVVSPIQENRHGIRRVIESNLVSLPVDLTTMSPEEVQEMDFIRVTGAQKI
ncbi:hypothetical protein RA26_14675 [Leisingera sp. ANG-M7]|nr:hypothetical protein RA26_14675 [Leisingera sp. ANG-M7]